MVISGNIIYSNNKGLTAFFITKKQYTVAQSYIIVYNVNERSDTMEMYTVKEVAKMLKVHEQTVFRWIRDGKIKSIKFENNHRITQEQLDRFLNTDKGE